MQSLFLQIFCLLPTSYSYKKKWSSFIIVIVNYQSWISEIHSNLWHPWFPSAFFAIPCWTAYFILILTYPVLLILVLVKCCRTRFWVNLSSLGGPSGDILNFPNFSVKIFLFYIIYSLFRAKRILLTDPLTLFHIHIQWTQFVFPMNTFYITV